MANTQLATRSDEASIFSSGEKWSLAVKMATSLAASTIVPKDFQGNANNTLVALELANRLQVSPLMVMQNLYVVYGRPSWSSQYIIGAINGSGKYDFELQYDEKNDDKGKPYSCQCWTERNGRKVTGPVITMDMAKAEGWVDKSGSKWKTMPQMMLRYRAASFFGRMNCPELIMGIYSREEVVDMGPDEYREVPVEEKVRQDIAQNANAVDFDEVAEIDTPVGEETVEMANTQSQGKTVSTVNTQSEKVTEEPAKEEPKMKARPKKKPEPEPEPVDDIEIQPEWA